MKIYTFDHGGKPYQIKAETEEEARNKLSEHLIKRFGIFAAQFPLLTTAVFQG